jgi:hypothetical protein
VSRREGGPTSGDLTVLGNGPVTGGSAILQTICVSDERIRERGHVMRSRADVPGYVRSPLWGSWNRLEVSRALAILPRDQ